MVDLLTCLLSKLYAVKKQELSQTLNNGLVQNWERNTKKGCKLSPSYLTYMQSTSCKMLGWMNPKAELRLLGEISATSDMQMIPL